MKAERPTVVSDWDETITDGTKQTEKCWELYGYKASEILLISQDKVLDQMEIAKREVLSNPGSYGWEYEGIIVAPVTADKYILSRTCVNMAAQNLGKHFSDEQLQAIFEYVSVQINPVFKQDATEYIRDLSAHTNLIIATNGSIDRIKKEEHILLGNNILNIRGSMKKNVLAENQTPMMIDGLSRPVYRRRKLYDEFLNTLKEPIFIIGDSWELDLANGQEKAEKGNRIITILVPSIGTPKWEINVCINHPNGQVVKSLAEAKNTILHRRFR